MRTCRVSEADSGAITLMQRFGSAANLEPPNLDLRPGVESAGTGQSGAPATGRQATSSRHIERAQQRGSMRA